MDFWQQLLTQLQQNKKVYLLTVIENFGSSPGRKGFKMLVADDGFIFGSVGGGVMEFTLVEEVKDLLQKENQPVFFRKQIHQGNGKDKSGMICSGEQTVVFHPIQTSNIQLVKNILNCINNNEPQTLSFTPNGIQLSKNTIADKYETQIESEKEWTFKEHIGFKETLYIVGGGHVGLAVSKLFRFLNFTVVVFDNRDNLNTLESNTFAHQKHVIDYTKITDFIKKGNDSYVVIMTNKYTDDKLVLSQLLRNKYAYVGVLGSKAKLKTMWEVLLKEGFKQKELDTVFAPIGIHIKSETPEEIAISIAAEIIQTKNKAL
ncbi:putative xanthine dehydrogenase subunit A [Polaribacter huanghezhanensis]|uniref:XdhC family protein n=1 Tax=Polaribacter huanghezhanensis TaxID=1354726 RepID=UPI002647EA87|nr:XdhC/CoxI family protein [Polaribacter huanghezhanensis]WKD84789.1 putative xanthine dehydrogenase subunit A [Polaribacter huanghezhanensis]